MRVVVCVRKSVSGEINPFDACAYEAALRIKGAEVTLLSMAPANCEDFMKKLTRLGAVKAILLSDPAFAGADTLATSYTLSLAVQKLSPDLVICGRQTVDGDTGQVGPELATLCDFELITRAMSVEAGEEKVTCAKRNGESVSAKYPALITVERINTLRRPSIRSKEAPVEIWSADELGADKNRCGLKGSPTKVIKSFENDRNFRRCKFIAKDEIKEVLGALSSEEKTVTQCDTIDRPMLKNVWVVGEPALKMARTVSDDIRLIDFDTPQNLARLIEQNKPYAVIFGSDAHSKEIAPQVAALLKTGLCADCTTLETDGSELFMYRPAFSGNIIAKIRCVTAPVMATVRTESEEMKNLVFGIGMGAVGDLDKVLAAADALKADVAASRVVVDKGILPYEKQVGLTGITISPKIYVALGISGAVHHVAGISAAKTVIAVNCDKNAPIFDFADYGIVCEVKEFLEHLLN